MHRRHLPIAILILMLLIPSTVLGQRDFHIGFSTWPYTPTVDAVDETYRFIAENGDIYLEQLDDKVPWQEVASGAPLPEAFAKEINEKVARRPSHIKLLLALTPLNGGRDGIAEAYSGDMPLQLAGKSFNDPAVIAAYTTYCQRMIDLFNPDYLIVGIEVNELLNNTPDKWPGYVEMSQAVQATLKDVYPDLKTSESVTLHKLINSETKDVRAYRQQIRDFVADLDLVAVSFYPLFVGHHTHEQFSSAFDLLREWTDKPLAIAETAHPAETIVAERWNFTFEASPAEQNEYIKVLLERAQSDEFAYVICFTWRDYDELWGTFPDPVKDLGRLWRDTGFVDENDVERDAMRTWRDVLRRRTEETNSVRQAD